MAFPLFPIGYGRQIIETLRSLAKSHETRITALENGGGGGGGGGPHIVKANVVVTESAATLKSKDFDYASVAADFDAGINVILDVDVTTTDPDMAIIDHWIRRLQLVQINKKDMYIHFGSTSGVESGQDQHFTINGDGNYDGYIDCYISSQT